MPPIAPICAYHVFVMTAATLAGAGYKARKEMSFKIVNQHEARQAISLMLMVRPIYSNHSSPQDVSPNTVPV
eukprot:12404670-Karenia_brevis.AAC.1